MSIGARLAKARKTAGLTQGGLAKLLKTRQSTVSDWERNINELPRAKLRTICSLLNLQPGALEFGERDQEDWDGPAAQVCKPIINLVGEIGAGGHINPVNDHAEGAGLDEVEAPPNTTKGTVAVVVRGDSLYPFLKDGALLYYSTRHDNVIDYLHEMVICHFTDGRKAVKVLTPGTETGTFTLTSVNAPPMLNEKIDSISTIDWMRP